jgi:flagellar motor component MotA
VLSDGSVETVYGNMPTFGLGAVTGVVAAMRRGQTAKSRLSGHDDETPAVDPY